MKLSTALTGTAALLLLLPLAVVQAADPFNGIGREVNEAVDHLAGFNLADNRYQPDNRYQSVSRSPGVIGQGRSRRNPATQTSRGPGDNDDRRGFRNPPGQSPRNVGVIGERIPRYEHSGGAGYTTEPVSYSPRASSYGYGYEPHSAGSTSYFATEPWANPAPSNAALYHYQDAQTFAQPGAYSYGPSRSSRPRSFGAIGDRIGKTSQSHEQSGGAGSSREAVSYSHVAPPYGHGYEPDSAWSTSYFSSQPEFHPTSSDAAHFYHQDSQALAHPGTDSEGPSHSFDVDQDSYHAVPSENEAFNAASPRSSRSSSPRSHPSWSDAKAAANALKLQEVKAQIARLSAGSEKSPFPTYLDMSGQDASHHPTDTAQPGNELTRQTGKAAVYAARRIAKEKFKTSLRTSKFHDSAITFLQGAVPMDNDGNPVHLVDLVPPAQAEAQLWAELVEVLLRNKVYHFGKEEASWVLSQFRKGLQEALYFSAIQMAMSYRLRLQVEYNTDIVRRLKEPWAKSLFEWELEKSRQVAALAWYFIKAGEETTNYEGMMTDEELPLEHAMMPRQQSRQQQG